ncbi:hypothetical protein AAFG07_21315 [Bradyrhizobium sp. B097]|uniref:hypothetical protein n=1 Tax=Bradyrhizobium sp. B097 TaxID=3140244 RepID=UPI003183DD7E
MIKTATTNSEAALLDMIARYDVMFARIGVFCETIARERCAEHQALADEAEQLAISIIATPAHTKAVLDAKWRVARCEGCERDLVLNRMAVHDSERIKARRRRPSKPPPRPPHTGKNQAPPWWRGFLFYGGAL